MRQLLDAARGEVRWEDRVVNVRQRVVMVVAMGVVAVVAAVSVNSLLARDEGGWFAYAPNTGVVFAPDRTWVTCRAALVWVAATMLWAGAAVWLLRSSADRDEARG